MDEITPLDRNWLSDNPIRQPDRATDKNGRGRVLAIGGCARVPGGLLLTVEAALRAGCGKVQAVAPRSTATALGIAMPEIAVLAVEEEDKGEIAALTSAELEAADRSDAVVAGPAMSCASAGGRIIDALLDREEGEGTLVLDAAALMGLPDRAAPLTARNRPAILTPHIGEIAAMLACDAASVERDRRVAVRQAASRFGAIVVLKGPNTLVSAPDGTLFAYAGGGVGLATGGSGDVLAGIAAGLASRGAEPLQAALWAVWLHGEAGRRCAEEIGPVGFLARELLAQVPRLLRG